MATIITGARAAYGYGVATGNNDAQNEALDVSSMLDVLNPHRTPLLTLIGTNSLSHDCTSAKHEWLEDEVRGISTTTTDTDLNNTTPGAAVVLTVAAGEGLKFRGSTNDYDNAPSDIVRISSTAGEELARVSATAASTTVTIERGYNSVTPVDHTGYTKTITVVSSAQLQGLTLVGASRTTTKANVYNYTQIFEDSLTVSATSMATKKITMNDDVAYQTKNILTVMKETMEMALLFGKRQAPAAQDPGLMSGVRQYITTNVYNKAGVALTETHLNDALQAVWTAGGGGDWLLVMHPTQKRRLDTFLDAYRRADYNDTTLGSFVKKVETNFGALDVVMDQNMPDTEVLILDRSRVGFGPLRPMGMSEIPVLSREARQWEITGEYTAELRQEKAHARIYGLSTTL